MYFCINYHSFFHRMNDIFSLIVNIIPVCQDVVNEILTVESITQLIDVT